MPPDFTFPLALCRAQWRVGLRMLAWLETCSAQSLALGAHLLDDRSERTRADAEAVSSAEDWASLAELAASTFGRARVRAAPARPDGKHPLPGPIAPAGHATASSPARQHAVDDALRALHRALNPPARRSRRARGTVRAKA
jgi:hypothetical protein